LAIDWPFDCGGGAGRMTGRVAEHMAGLAAPAE